VNILVYVYNSFDDPLFSGNLMMYINKARLDGNTQSYYIITYEQKEYLMSEKSMQQRKEELKKQGIFWYPLKWHSARFPLAVKVYDFIKGTILIGRLRFTKSVKWLITLGSVSGSFGFVISRLLGMKQYAYQFEPHSEFLLDMGLNKKHSLTYILLNKFENLAGRYAEIISTGTDAMIKRLKHEGARGQLFKIPSAVDEVRFNYNEQLRKKTREELNISDKNVFIYAGKTGGLYFSEELFMLFKHLNEKIENSFFIVLTPQPKDYYLEMFNKYHIAADSFFISRVAHDEIPKYLCAADLGIVAIPPLKAQKFRSPIKVGEYLLCGLPYITCKGVSEDDVTAENYQTGVAMADFSEPEIIASMLKIKNILETDKNTMVRRCREVGVNYRGLNKYFQVYSDIINSMN
jgi:hypothetical protein